MRSILGFVIGALMFSTAAPATVYVVRPDGSGDFLTIQAALNAVTNGDIIGLSNGTFSGPGNRDLDYLGKAVIVRSQSGSPEFCTIDCGGGPGNPHRGVYFHSGETETSVLEGVTISGGYAWGNGGSQADWGGAILCVYASPRLFRCVFSDNQARDSGGAIWVSYGSPVISECTFSDNRAQWGGGLLLWSSNAEVTECWFADNQTTANGGGIYCTTGTSSIITRVTLCANQTDGRGGAIVCNNCSPSFSQCTCSGNQAHSGGSGIWTLNDAQPTFDHTIIAFSPYGASVSCGDGAGASLICCDVYGNAGGDWVSCIADQVGVAGNFAADPLFCDSENRDFTLGSDSPCAPIGDCGLIGAWPVGCGPTAVETTSWGMLKAKFR